MARRGGFVLKQTKGMQHNIYSLGRDYFILLFKCLHLTNLQEIESYIVNWSRTVFIPKIGKKIFLFIDDLNLLHIETYRIHNTIALLTQHI